MQLCFVILFPPTMKHQCSLGPRRECVRACECVGDRLLENCRFCSEENRLDVKKYIIVDGRCDCM